MDTSVLLISMAFALLTIFGIAAFIKSKTLKIRVDLGSLARYRNYSPEKYFFEMSLEELEVVASLLEPDSKYEKMNLIWYYTTPAGKNTYTSNRFYTKEEVSELLEKVGPAIRDGAQNISILNDFYRSALAAGQSIVDGNPKIYCYSLPEFPDKNGLVKVGYAKNDAIKRIEAQLKTAAHLKVNYRVHFILPAVTINGEEFMDHKIHRLLKSAGIKNPVGEWFECSSKEAEQMVVKAQNNLS